MDPVKILICLVLIAFSAFVAGAEVALFSLSKFQLKHIRERFRAAYKMIRQLLGDPGGLLTTILITNELVNVALSTLIASLLSQSYEFGWISAWRDSLMTHMPEWAADMVVGTAITSPIILIICEISPKIISARMNAVAGPLVARPMLLIYKVMSPVRYVAQGFMRFVSLIIPKKKGWTGRYAPSTRLRQEDFLNMVEEAHREGDVMETELELIRSVFDMDDTAVSEVTTPLSQVFVMPAQETVEKALATLHHQRQKFSRVPVYEKDRTNITGILYSKDLLVAKLEKANLQQPISSLTWKPFMVNETTRLNSVFRKMKKQRTHMAIVVNDRGEAVGIVTMNDLLEALLDELVNEEGAEA